MEFNFTEAGAIRFSTRDLPSQFLVMSVLRKKTEFYEGGSDRKVIVIAAGSLGEGAALAGRFFH